nr:ABC transporter permease [uncultured Clostridium sp.]
MLSKIALKNIKKSFKDYSIYFLTLTFAVCIFYSFNSLDSQMAIAKMNAVQTGYVEVMKNLMAGVSIFVSVILGALIIYATNFLIKKRKKEFGIYMMLGMGKWKISKILIIETLFVGAISLIAGLLLGIFLSQGLSLLTVKMFLVELSQYKFVISWKAIGRSILYFGLIYLVVIIFNTLVISKYKLIDLINSSRKSEKITVRSAGLSFTILIASIVILVVAYYLASVTNLDFNDYRFLTSIFLGIIGTLGFFFGASSVLLLILKKSDNLYYNNLNTFTIRQITNKFNTNFISMAVICLMLFVTIGILTTGLSMKKSFEGITKKFTPYDLSCSLNKDNEESNIPIEEALAKYHIILDENTEYITMNTYMIDFSIKDLLGKYTDTGSELINFNPVFEKAQVISVTDFNKNRKLLGKKELSLNDNEIYISSNLESMIPTIERFLKENNEIIIGEKTYVIKEKKVLDDSLGTTGASNNIFSFIVPDDFCNNLTADSEYININYVGEGKERKKEEVAKILEGYMTIEPGVIGDDIKLLAMSREIAYDSSVGMSTIILFVAIYIGIVFLLSSAVVLAIQQLAQCNDSLERYEVLRKIGASRRQINKSILVEVLTFFIMPLSLAIIHSIVGINIVEEYLQNFGNYDILISSLITALIFVIVYGGYFYATYIGYRNAIDD